MIKKPSKMPTAAGVYVFRGQGTKPLYIGKAANLKKRLASYWRKNVGDRVRRLLTEATKAEWIETESEIEALLKEAELIKKYRPKYNVLMRDDKNYFYVGVTREAFPKVFITHQPFAADQVKSLKFKVKSFSQKLKIDYLGPYTSGAALKETLRLLRRVFPYCTCKKPHTRPCLNAQIGRCPGCCCLFKNYTTSQRSLASCIVQYRHNIQNLVAVLSGSKKKIFGVLKLQMYNAAKKQNFEQAAKLRDQIAGLENVFEHRLPWKANLDAGRPSWERIESTLKLVLGIKQSISRVEGYDISNISGTDATGSMVVFIDGKPAKSEYRKFKIKTVRGANDVAMHREVLRRRLTHHEWRYPDVMLIDGGKPQLNAALSGVRPRNFAGF